MKTRTQVTLTKAEQKAIASLERLAKKWPKSLYLFGWAGGDCRVVKNSVRPCVVAAVPIIADGGDPGEWQGDARRTEDFDVDPDIFRE